MNAPNSITVLRVLLVPIFVAFAYGHTRGSALAAFTVFIVASLSDFVDGYLARKYEIETRFGRFVDPLADKLLVGAALYVLVDTRGFPLWAAVVIAVREVAVQVLRTRIVATGRDLPASKTAKLKTIIQICMVGWWLLPWEELNPVHWIWLGAAIVATLYSGAEYFNGYRREVVARES
ncbi:MAG: CDP-diacylglycerol---glycerol-3-phosphate 3-phosphatidyltransferase [Actinomycetota bacterium]|nr:CDP-diacylglycerol---glycerol-3-phosphate 3-phosphatidyltransferase [Actinomycetota bacterium]